MEEENAAASLAEAQAHLTRLAAAGASPARITGEVGALVAGWASELEMAGSTAQARVERLWDGFTRDAAELQEQIGDADDGPGGEALALARQQLAALRAIVAALEAAHGVLPGIEQ